MLRGLITNTLISAVAFVAMAGIPLLLVPLVVGHYGIVEYGLVVLVRILLPTGALAIFDFGNSEIAIQTTVRARHDGDWASAGRRLWGLTLITFTAGLVVATALGFTAAHLGEVFKVPVSARPAFQQIILATSAAFPFLLMALIVEGVLKGFEAFKSLRIAEVSCAMAYGVAAIGTLLVDLGYQWIAFAYLGSLLVRAVVIVVLAARLVRGRGFRFARPYRVDWQDVGQRARVMVGNRTLGAAQSQAAPLVIGALLGASAVGVYDLIIRFPRFLKVVIGLMNTAVLPVSARLDVTQDVDGMRRLGELGLLGSVAVAAPICAWGASFSEPVLRLWINDKYSVFWPWQSLMFVVPLINAMTSFGGGALLGRPHVVAKLNAIAVGQILIQFALGFALMGLQGERAFLVGQAAAVFLSFPFQMSLIASEKKLALGMFRRHTAIVGVFAMLTALCFAVGAADWMITVVDLALSLAAWLALSYLAMWFLVLRPEERDAFRSLLRGRGDRKTAMTPEEQSGVHDSGAAVD